MILPIENYYFEATDHNGIIIAYYPTATELIVHLLLHIDHKGFYDGAELWTEERENFTILQQQVLLSLLHVQAEEIRNSKYDFSLNLDI